MFLYYNIFFKILKYILKRIAYNKCIINDTSIDMNFNNLRQCQVTYEKMSQKKKGVSDSKQGVWLSQQFHATIAIRLVLNRLPFRLHH